MKWSEAEEEEVAAAEPVPDVPKTAEEVATQEESEVAVNVKPDPKPDPEPDPEPVREDRTAHFVQEPRQSHCPGVAGLRETEGTGNQGRKLERLMAEVWCPGDFGDAMLNGGTMIGEPRLSERPNEQGTVRVNIVVDGTGKVIQASPDYQSLVTTLTDSYHVNLAMRAAKTALFDADPMKPRRTGYITIQIRP